ncbi:Uncharacterised protein [Mycobacteroides abscessus subsp. abscessus]|nr:Uncharacterised protein [Mycobacteroides abscessus subsp. abscessus]
MVLKKLNYLINLIQMIIKYSWLLKNTKQALISLYYTPCL